jgi:hypothetical protein
MGYCSGVREVGARTVTCQADVTKVWHVMSEEHACRRFQLLIKRCRSTGLSLFVTTQRGSLNA